MANLTSFGYLKQVAQLQKQKKKANKKGAGTDTPKDSESPKEDPATPAAEEAPTTEEKQDAPEPAAEKKEGEGEEQGKPEEPEREGSPTEPMPEAPTSLPSEVDSASRLDAPRPGTHGRQPSLSIQSKMRSSSFRKTSVSQGSVSPSPSTTMRSPSLPPLSADGDSVQEVYRKQSARIEELEKDNKRLEKEREEASGRWRKTEEQLEDLRESSVDAAELKDKLEKAEQKAADIDSLVRMPEHTTWKGGRANSFTTRKRRLHLSSDRTRIFRRNRIVTIRVPLSLRHPIWCSS